MKIRVLAFALAFLGLASPALAQAPATVKLCVQNGATCTPVTSGNPLPTSGGGGGGGGAVTIANGADVAEGSTTDVPCTLPATATPCTMEAVAKAVANAVNSAIPAGSAIIGKVGIDQTTPGTTNGVQLTGSGQVAVSVAPVTATNTATVVDLRPDSPGIISLGPATPSASVPTVSAGYTYAHVAAGQATTVIKAAPGVLHSITFNSAATATNVTTVYDNASGSGTVIAIPAATTATIVGLTLAFDVSFVNGLTIITTTANGADMTVSFR